jgi:hypothetical protein
VIRQLVVISCALALPMSGLTDEPTVRVAPPHLQGSRPLETQTESAVLRDYLQSWKTLQVALDQNQASLLDQNFVGTARQKFENTIDEQLKLGIHTRYQERSHEIQIVFYSPDGQSIQMVDNVEYEQAVLDHDNVLSTRPIRKKYLVVLTPTEVRWKVRVLQGDVSQPS